MDNEMKKDSEAASEDAGQTEVNASEPESPETGESKAQTEPAAPEGSGLSKKKKILKKRSSAQPKSKLSENEEQDEESVLTGKERRRRRRRGKKKENKKRKKPGKKFFIITGSIIGAFVLVYLAVSAFFISHFYINTTINGKDFSGKTASDVAEYIQKQVGEYELTIVEQNNDRNLIKGSEIGLGYEESSDIQKTLESQNPLLWPAGFFKKSVESISVDVEYDEALLDEKLQSIKGVQKEQTESASAYPKYNGTAYEIVPEVYGTAVNTEVLKEKTELYISELRDTLKMMDEGCYTLPRFTSSSEEVKKACEALNKYVKSKITYTMDEDIVVDSELISKWLSCDADMNVTFDEEAVKEWMREFGKKYDTVGTTRSITTPDGKQAEVSGGTYGWVVNESEEAKNLIENIKKGETVKKEPEYKQTAASRSAQDWGSTYIEVDISAQKMWYIADGSVALTSDVVTGLPADDRDTPTGVYSILYTERDSTLKGEIDPATGKPSYETPVAFWMPFTYQGHGFHDATWQAQFGGDWYKAHGSHGCVNMPYDNASKLFDMISAGTPVIVHN